MGRQGRNYGIDLLRIVSMLMVLVLHILGVGGILKTATPLSADYEVAWFLEIAAYCAVNCYALVSGYVGLYSKFKYTNIACTWLQVAFYNVLFSAVAAFLLPEITRRHIFDACMPVYNNFYWYFTAYFAVFFLAPLFNRAILALSDKQLYAVAATIFFLFSLAPTFKSGDVFFINRGYSALWLALLYVLGAALRKCDIGSKIKARTAFLGYAACILITWGYKYMAEYHNAADPAAKSWPVFAVTYISPLILLSGIFLVIAFSQLRVAKVPQKLIAFFAPLSFGVYLIHTQRYAWRYLLSGRFAPLATWHPLALGGAVLLFALALFVVCALIEYLRDLLFRLLHIREWLTKIESRLLKDLWNTTET